ncbi:hypothetical protein T484DRAFT_1890917, partial [Baffinella frigidus]
MATHALLGWRQEARAAQARLRRAREARAARAPLRGAKPAASRHARRLMGRAFASLVAAAERNGAATRCLAMAAARHRMQCFSRWAVHCAGRQLGGKVERRCAALSARFRGAGALRGWRRGISERKASASRKHRVRDHVLRKAVRRWVARAALCRTGRTMTDGVRRKACSRLSHRVFAQARVVGVQGWRLEGSTLLR